MLKTTKKHFALFRRTFRYWQNKLNCSDYLVWFEHVKLDDASANIHVDYNTKAATVRLATVIYSPIEDIARHEALHLMMGKYSHLANKRYATSEEISEAEESIVRILTIALDKQKKA